MDEQEENLVSLASGIAKDSRLLIDQEMGVLRAELSNHWKEAKRAVPYFFLGSVAFITVSHLACQSLAEWLVVHRGFSLWVSYALIAIVGLISALALFAFGRQHLRMISLPPKETVNSIKENLQCLIN